MPLNEETKEVKIKEAIDELYSALTENIEANKAETHAKQRKEKAHYRLGQAKETLTAIEKEINE